MKAAAYLLAGGVLFTGVFLGGVFLGGIGVFALAKDDIELGQKTRKAQKYTGGLTEVLE